LTQADRCHSCCYGLIRTDAGSILELNAGANVFLYASAIKPSLFNVSISSFTHSKSAVLPFATAGAMASSFPIASTRATNPGLSLIHPKIRVLSCAKAAPRPSNNAWKVSVFFLYGQQFKLIQFYPVGFPAPWVGAEKLRAFLKL
jgi:hypothetical protein